MSTASTLAIIFGGASYRKTSGYGYRIHPRTKKKRFHYGVDYGCGKVAVHAIESGVVYKRGPLKLLENLQAKANGYYEE